MWGGTQWDFSREGLDGGGLSWEIVGRRRQGMIFEKIPMIIAERG